MNFDLVVLGGGVGGYAGAIRAAKRGLNVALVEERDLGGTCLNRGCIPVKTLLHSAEVFAQSSEFDELGILADNVSYDEEKIYARKNAIATKLRDGVCSLLKGNKVACYQGRGTIVDAHTILVGENTLQTKYILLATGSTPATLKISGIENALNSDEILEKPLDAKRITIIGGGVIGVEFASYFSSLCREVTIVEVAPRILPMMSRDISFHLSSVLKKSGVKILASAKVTKIHFDKSVVVETEKGESVLDADAVIVAIGRKCNLSNIGLENAGVEFDRFVKVNNKMQTNIENIFACGDIVGREQLAHFASASAIVAVENILGDAPSIDLSVVPSCVYTNPQIAVVGKVELYEGFKQGKFMMGANGKSLIQGSNRGFVKVVTDENDVVVGAEVFAVNGTEIIGELALAVQKKMKITELTKVIRAHPTIMEAVGEASEDIFGLATHKL